MQKNLIFRKLLYMLILLAATVSGGLWAQVPGTISVKGVVSDEAGKPVSGASVEVKGTTAATRTDDAGRFTITAPKDAVVGISSVGYETQELTVSGPAINVVLKQKTSSMDEVVVIGYGSRKKSDVTGATASISGDKLRTVPASNLTQALQGRITGVVATPSSFKPGAGATIRIRGNRSLNASNEPLYVVDGFPVSYTIDDLNPADIESVDILKDASATAIYGVRGANGVVQITTRKGRAGKVSVTYMGSKSIEKVTRPLPVFNGAEIADAWRQAFFADRQYTATRGTASASNPLYYYPTAVNDIALFWKRFGSEAQWNAVKDAYTWDVYDPVNNIFRARKRATTAEERALMQGLGITTQLDSVDLYDPSKVKGYDWQNEVGLRNGSTDNHSISVSGGSEKIKASLSAGYFKQKGIEWAQDYTRYSIGNTVDFKPARFLNFGTSINFSHSITNSSTSSFGNASGMIPLVTPYDSAGKWVLYPNGDQQIRSAINDRNTVFDETKANRIFGNVYAEVTLLKGLKYRTMFGADIRSSVRGQFNGAESSVRLGGLASASQTDNRASSWVFDNIVTYNTSIKNDHSLNVTLLHEMQSLNRSSSLTMSANNLIFESQKWYSLQRNTDATVTGSGDFSASQYLSYMARVEYGFRSKYLLTLSNRYDNSSVLSEDNKGAWFPSGSIAWQLDRESFFSNQGFFNSAKIRAGIGRVGNASIDPYQTGGPLAFTNYNWGNGTAAIGTAPSTFPTPGLGWEKTTTTNLGLEFGLLNNRITGTVDLYNSNTTDLLQKRTIPAANGVTWMYFNLGKVNNRGIEIALTTRNIARPEFSWTTDFMFTKNKERIVDIDGSGNSNYANLWILGQPLQVYWSYKKEGIFQYADTAANGILSAIFWPKNGRTNSAYQPGKIKIFDANGDSAFSPIDKVVLGSHNPDFIASVNNTFTYKNFELNFLTYFRVGGLYRVPRPGLVGRYQSSKVDYWTPSNPSNDYQQPTQTSDIPLYWEALTYRKATFIRVKNITLTYRLPRHFTERAHMSNMAVYVTAMNPVLIHNADKNYDPETVPYKEFVDVSNTGQVGPNSYSYRSFVLGVRVDL
ncbi:TonB-dependent receptor [Niabella sp. CC-SYL272]|uniref:SusC/RagA family TonB-linked outer membrane protein n=1 Tax=Niabella agricola TaxID=2891571 RepID=UPI001F429F34|nr:TonB-dependent receptor [Niabella agricola]MCF3108154.1 TonB-dependent receptor [Niabella agricola]